MQTNSILILAGFVIVAAAAVLITVNIFEKKARAIQEEAQKEIKKISTNVIHIVNEDSIRSRLESQIMDSINTLLDKRDIRIDALKKDITNNRRKDEALEKRINDLPLAMPEF